jgi:hypothetical protein
MILQGFRMLISAKFQAKSFECIVSIFFLYKIGVNLVVPKVFVDGGGGGGGVGKKIRYIREK